MINKEDPVIVINGKTVTIKKTTAILLFFLALFSLMGNLTAPLIWANNLTNRIDNIETTTKATEKRSITNSEDVRRNAIVNNTIEFNLKRLMKDKFNMDYIEQPIRTLKSNTNE